MRDSKSSRIENYIRFRVKHALAKKSSSTLSSRAENFVARLNRIIEAEEADPNPSVYSKQRLRNFQHARKEVQEALDNLDETLLTWEDEVGRWL